MDVYKRLNIRMPPQMFAQLKSVMARTGLSVSEVIRRAVDEYLWNNK